MVRRRTPHQPAGPAIGQPVNAPGLAEPWATIAGTAEHEIEVRRSRFLTRLVHVETVAAAEDVVAIARRERWDARHHCSAFVVGRLGELQRSSDDGEPSGTAGAPMLEVLRHRQVTDVVAVVTRYFGGVLLGAGGLVRAYTDAVAECLDQATVVPRAWRYRGELVVDVSQAGRLDNQLRTWADGPAGAAAQVEHLGVSYRGSAAVLALAAAPAGRAAADAVAARLTSGTGAIRWAEAPEVVDLPARE